MKSFIPEHMRVRAWAFSLIACVELPGIILLFSLRSAPGPMGGPWLAAVQLTFGCLAVEWALVGAWTLFLRYAGSPRWRSVGAAVVVYLFIATVGGVVLSLLAIGIGRVSIQAIAIPVVFVVSRAVTVLLVAVVLEESIASWRTHQEVKAILRGTLQRLRASNELLAAAERDLRHESARRLQAHVVEPLTGLIAVAPDLTSDELADRVDGFIAKELRPMAHHLHPVSVRLGLATAVRSLSPDIDVRIPEAFERLDADGDLLDDDVRLQLYRWVRDATANRGPVLVTVHVDGRSLCVSVMPAVAGPEPDAVQAVAGLRVVAPGQVRCPLRGQAAPTWDAAPEPMALDADVTVRISPWAALATPLPRATAIVALLSLGSGAVYPVYGQPFTLGVLLGHAIWILAPVATAALLQRLPPPAATASGSLRVVLGWIAVGLSAAVASAVVTSAMGGRALMSGLLLLEVGRALVRFTVPGLFLAASHGLVIATREELAQAEELVEIEKDRRDAILRHSQRVERDVAEALHRTVQGRLAAVVVMLRLDRRSEAWAELLHVATDTAPALIQRLESPSSEGHLVARDVPPGLLVHESVRAVDIPPDVLVDLRRAASEAAVNAKVHGRAHRIWVTVAPTPTGYRLTCRDDGVGLPSDSSPGLGCRLLEDIATRWSGEWSMESAHPGCTVTVEVNLVPQSSTR